MLMLDRRYGENILVDRLGIFFVDRFGIYEEDKMSN